MSINYFIDARDLEKLAKGLFIEAPRVAATRAARIIAGEAMSTMMRESPSSMKSGRGYRGPPLRMSITVEPFGKSGWSVGPTKMVDGKSLGGMIEYGTNSRVVIRPRVKQALKFFWDGKIQYRSKVRRGATPPNPFVKRTRDKVAIEMVDLAKQVYMDEFWGITV